MLDFELARSFNWELIWRGEPTSVAVQFVPLKYVSGKNTKARLLFTPEDEQTLWCLSSCQFGLVATFDWSASDADLRFYLESAIATSHTGKYHFGRCFDVPMVEERRSAYITLSHRLGTQAVELVYESYGSLMGEDNLHLPVTAEEFVVWSNRRIQSWLNAQWDDPRSELRFLMWWDATEYPARTNFLRKRVINYAELERVTLRLIRFKRSAAHDTFFRIFKKWKMRWRDYNDEKSDDKTPIYSTRIDGFELTYAMPLEPEPGDEIPFCVEHHLWQIVSRAAYAEDTKPSERIEAGEFLHSWLKANFDTHEFESIWKTLTSE